MKIRKPVPLDMRSLTIASTTRTAGCLWCSKVCQRVVLDKLVQDSPPEEIQKPLKSTNLVEPLVFERDVITIGIQVYHRQIHIWWYQMIALQGAVYQNGTTSMWTLSKRPTGAHRGQYIFFSTCSWPPGRFCLNWSLQPTTWTSRACWTWPVPRWPPWSKARIPRTQKTGLFVSPCWHDHRVKTTMLLFRVVAFLIQMDGMDLA